MARVGTSPQDGDHGVGGGELEFEVHDPHGGVHPDTFVDQLPDAVGALRVVATVAAVPAGRAMSGEQAGRFGGA